MTTANAMHFRLLPSRRIALLIVLAHVGAALALLTVAHAWVSGWVLAALLVALGFATAWDRALLGARGSVREFSLEGPHEVLLGLRGRGRVRSRVAARRWVSARLVVLPLALPTRGALLVAGDMLGAEDFRRLRLWALWGRLPGVASTPRRVV